MIIFHYPSNKTDHPFLAHISLFDISLRRAIILVAFALLGCANAAVIGHDAVAPFKQPTPSTTLQKLAVTFKPQIYIANGCHPYPAVDEDGNTSGGLKPTGGQSSGCIRPRLGSQIYGRAVKYRGVYAFMYSWYMPKDQTLPGLGHRHDWEACVVWIDDITLDEPNIVALSASYHNTYQTYYPPDKTYLDGNSAKIEYSTSLLLMNHSLWATSTPGEKQDLIMWDQLTDAARTALEGTDFGGARVPFKDANFKAKLAEAYYRKRVKQI